MPDLSVIITTYSGDDSHELYQSLCSVSEQVRTPEEVVIVKDGKVGDEISNTVKEFKKSFSNDCKIIQLETNQGHGAALREGVKSANSKLVAIQDADDICVPSRFEIQIEYFKQNDIDLVGGTIAEFSNDYSNTYAKREVPENHEDIVSMARYRCPINQTTVMACRSEILEAGNYRAVDRMEDYDLWARMIMNGAKFANIPEVLVKVRAGENMYARRGGFEYAREEIRQQRDFLKYGFVSPAQAFINVLIRVPVRLLPNKARGYIYKKFLR